ncbi:MAG: hypothetical protein KJ050_10035 [Candidatus Omnitrophica bacterium]|nr:hypothetical protein [bacterium]MCL4735262.1 hypothetical protein [Candidatus Omnitrophota bacterium]
MKAKFFCILCLMSLSLASYSAPRIVVQELGTTTEALTIQHSDSDDLNGILAVMVSPTPWHPVNTNPADQEAAFTDGQGLGGLTGLLNDCLRGCGTSANQNVPAAVAEWYFSEPHNIAELRVFTGNYGHDGRIFHHYDVAMTTDPFPEGASYDVPLIEEVTPVPSGIPGVGGFGLVGNPNPPGTYEASLSVVNDDAGGPLAEGVTGMRITFYQVSNTAGAFRDDWNAGEGDDRDGQDAGFESPLVYEVDLFFGNAPITNPTGVTDWSLY